MASKNLVTKTTIQNLTAEVKKTFSKKTELPTKVSQLTNDSGFQTQSQVETAINAKVSSTYRAGGSVAFASLPQLTDENIGLVVNVTDAFTTTASFIDGAGKTHPAGTNVAIVQVGGAIKYDVMAGFVDLSGYAEKPTPSTAGNLAALDADGNLVDSGKKPADFLTAHQNISGKADKDTDAVAGNFAAFDANGNPVDSGKKPSDYLTAHQNITGKADKKVPAAAGNVATLDATGNLTDSGIASAKLVVASDISDFTAEEIANLLK